MGDQVLLLVIGFALTSVLGGALGWFFQNRSWSHQHRVQQRDQERVQAMKVFEEVSSLLDQRLYRMRLVFWAAKRGSTEALDEARARYRDVVTTWNDNLNRNLALVETYFGGATRHRLEDDIYEEFSAIGRALEQYVRDGGTPEDSSIGRRLSWLGRQVYDFNVSALDLLQTDRVGRDAPAAAPRADNPTPLLQFGHQGSAVSDLQDALAAAGHFDARVDGSFGRDTETAVRQLQESAGPGRRRRRRPRDLGGDPEAMKVLALYDIHGNLDALEAVLADPRAQGADAVVVGGDVVPGPFARATLDRLEALESPVRWLCGNGEREVAEAVGAPAPAEDDVVAQFASITAAELGDERALALGELPLTLELDGVLYCHASPRRDDEILTRLSSETRWADAFAGVDAPLVVGGHTHQQDDRVVGSRRFVNAGSVGLPYEGDGAARWLWVVDGAPELRATTYDAAAAGERMLAAGWPDEQSIGAALLDPVEPIVVTRIFEDRA